MAHFNEAALDFIATQGSTYIDSPTKLINEVTIQSPSLADFLRGAMGAKTIQGGKDIRFQRFAEETSLTQDYSSGLEKLPLPNPQVVSEGVEYWRFTTTPQVWPDELLDLEVSTSESMEARYRKIKDKMEVLDQVVFTDAIKKHEADLWRPANITMMNGAGAKQSLSIPVFVSEQAWATRIGAGGDWNGTNETIHGIDPATDTTYDNYRATYASAAGLFGGMDDVLLSLHWKPMPFRPQVGEPDSNYNKVYTNKFGKLLHMAQTRASNSDLLGGSNRSDAAYVSPLYAGMPVEYVSELDTSAAFPANGGGYTTMGAADLAGPRFFFLNTKYISKIWHSDRFFDKKRSATSLETPYANAIHIRTYHNMICTSRKRQGILSPSADITGYTV